MPWRSRYADSPTGQAPSSGTTRSTTRSSAVPAHVTSRASPLASMATHEPGSSTLSGRGGGAGSLSAAAASTTARADRRRDADELPGIPGRRRGPRRGRAAPWRRVEWDDGAGRAALSQRRQFGVVGGAASGMAQHPIGLVDRRHRARVAGIVVGMVDAGRGCGRRGGSPPSMPSTRPRGPRSGVMTA